MNVIDSIKIGTDTDEGLITLPYAYCETVAGTADKVIAPTNFVVETGTIVVVKFKETNSAENPKLKYGESAKPIHYHGSAITAKYLKAGYVYTFIYTGSAWDLIGEIDTQGSNTSHSHDAGVGLICSGSGGTSGETITYSIDVGTGNGGKVLKVTADGKNVEWAEASSGLPSGGNAGQVLTSNGDTSSWKTPAAYYDSSLKAILFNFNA